MALYARSGWREPVRLATRPLPAVYWAGADKSGSGRRRGQTAICAMALLEKFA
jgi:hypothetical protein